MVRTAGHRPRWPRGKTRGSPCVIAGPVPAISIRRAQCANYRDGRDKPGHDQVEPPRVFAPVTEFRISAQLSGKKGDFLHKACVHRSVRQLAPFWQNEIPLFLQVNSWACRGVGKQGQNLWRQFVIAGLVPAILISRAQCPTLGMAGISPAMTEPEPPRLLPLLQWLWLSL